MPYDKSIVGLDQSIAQFIFNVDGDNHRWNAESISVFCIDTFYNKKNKSNMFILAVLYC